MSKRKGNSGLSPAAQFGTFDSDDYTPATLYYEYNEKELRAEYSKLRDIARKRINRLEQTEYAETQWLKDQLGYIDGLKPLKEIKDKWELAERLTVLHHFGEENRSTVRGARDYYTDAVDTLHSHGYNFVDARNFDRFVSFMEYARAAKVLRYVDSDRVAEFFGEHRDENPEEVQANFDKWLGSEQG